MAPKVEANALRSTGALANEWCVYASSGPLEATFTRHSAQREFRFDRSVRMVPSDCGRTGFGDT